MLLHLVLFRFKPGTSAERIAQARDALLSLSGRIPEIRRIRWGPNLGPSSEEYPFAFQVWFDSMDAVQVYLDHPLHRRAVAEQVAEIREARLAVDVEVDGAG